MSAKAQKVLWQPHAGPQTVFLELSVDECLYGGARGGGKTDCLLYGALRQVGNPNFKGLFLRATFKQLQEVKDRALLVFQQVGGEWRASEDRFVFPSGATIRFGYCETYADALQYQGQEFTYIAYDEIGNLKEERAWDFLLTCLRTTDTSLIKMARCSANPGGVAHGWLKRRFISACPPDGTPIWVTFKLPDGRVVHRSRAFVQARVDDNPSLYDKDPGYVAMLMGLPEVMRQQHLDGNWDAGSGLAFEKLGELTHVVEKADVPGWAQVFAALDWGFGHRWASSFAYLRPDGKLHVIDTASGSGQTPDVIVDRMRDVLRSRGLDFSRLAFTAAGSDIKMSGEARGHYGPTMTELFGRYGWFTMNADQSRVAGYQNLLIRVERGLIEWENTPGNRAVVEQMRSLVVDPDFPSDVLKVNYDPMRDEGGDDYYDMTRYLAMSRPLTSVQPGPSPSLVERRGYFKPLTTPHGAGYAEMPAYSQSLGTRSTEV